jgi:hypothetical protein
MSNSPADPDLLTTHQYMQGAVAEWATLRYRRLEHGGTTGEIEPNEVIDAAHILEAEYIIPLRRDPVTQDARPYGPRSLTLKAWGPPEAKRAELPVGSSLKWTPDGMQQRQLASARFSFNTKRVLDVTGMVYADGTAIGLDAAKVKDESPDNLLLAELALLAARQSLTVAQAARLIMSDSIMLSSSIERRRADLRIGPLARKIQAQTGKRLPDSLQCLRTQVNIYERVGLPASPGAPTTTVRKITIDDFGAPGGRVLTDYVTTEYQGYTPARPEHLALHTVRTAGGRPTALSFGIDVREQPVLGERSPTVATTAQEARTMVQPFVRTITNLRRYQRAAISELVGEVDTSRGKRLRA